MFWAWLAPRGASLPPTSRPDERDASLLVVLSARVELAGEEAAAHCQFGRHAEADRGFDGLERQARPARRRAAEWRRRCSFMTRSDEPPRRQGLRALQEPCRSGIAGRTGGELLACPFRGELGIADRVFPLYRPHRQLAIASDHAADFLGGGVM